MELSPEKKMAIQALVLGSRSQESAAQFVLSMGFIFREIKKIDQSMRKSYQVASRRVQRKEPNLSDDEVYQKVISQKPFMVRFLKSERKKVVFFETLILQLSGWIKSSYKMHAKTLARYSKNTPSHWAEKFLEIGPKYRKLAWAQSVNVASNYVRHKEEWHFNSVEIDPQTRKLKTRKNIIKTLEGGRPRRTAQYLISLGVSETILFGAIHDASNEILNLIESNESAPLKENCENWLSSLNDYAKTSLYKLI